MSDLSGLLNEYYKRSPYTSVAALAKAARAYCPISEPYLKQILSGARRRPSYDKLMGIIRALDLSIEDANRLLAAADLSPLDLGSYDYAAVANSRIQQILDALVRLQHQTTASSLQAVLDGILLLIEGVRTAADAAARADEVRIAVPAPALRLLPPAALGPVEGLVDDLLGEILSRNSDHPLDTLFLFLEEGAKGERGWEIKRRIAEALPQLVRLQPDATFRLATALRGDYHTDYRSDIRRRVVEAVPALYHYSPERALPLLDFHEGDEIYTVMAIVEALHDLRRDGLITAVAFDRHFAALRLEPHEEVISYLHRLLHELNENPVVALLTMRSNREHRDKLIKICTVRIAPRLLASHPRQAIELITYFVRSEDGEMAEHKNVRRAVSKSVPQIIPLLTENPNLKAEIGNLFQALAQDPDIHVRRALGDALNQLATAAPELAIEILDTLSYDSDPYVRQRAGKALLKLADVYPEKARSYYAAVLAASAA